MNSTNWMDLCKIHWVNNRIRTWKMKEESLSNLTERLSSFVILFSFTFLFVFLYLLFSIYFGQQTQWVFGLVFTPLDVSTQTIQRKMSFVVLFGRSIGTVLTGSKSTTTISQRHTRTQTQRRTHIEREREYFTNKWHTCTGPQGTYTQSSTATKQQLVAFECMWNKAVPVREHICVSIRLCIGMSMICFF